MIKKMISKLKDKFINDKNNVIVKENILLFNKEHSKIQEFKIKIDKATREFALNKLQEVCENLNIDYTYIVLRQNILLTLKSQEINVDNLKMLFNEFSSCVERM